jgi:multidrug efflux pump subunit AcrA (membrane-fusion protein)
VAPLSQLETSNNQPFNGYDDIAGGLSEPHAQPQIPASYKPGTGFRLVTIAIIIAIALGGAFFYVGSLKARDEAQLAAETEAKLKEPPAVEIITAALAPSAQTLRLPAEAHGWYSSTIFARVSGYVKKWLVDIGDRVKKDQVLAIIDTPEFDA